MKNMITAGLIAGMLMVGAAAAMALPFMGTGAWVQVNHEDVIALEWTLDAENNFTVPEQVIAGDGWFGVIMATGDNTITYAQGWENNTGAPMTFELLLSTPLSGVTSDYVVDASIVGGITDRTGNGVSLLAVLPDGDGDGVLELQASDIDGINAGADVGLSAIHGPGQPGALHTYGEYREVNPVFAAGSYNNLNLHLKFSLSGGGDAVALTGYSKVIPAIPEPATLLLLGTGLAGLAFWRIRRRA